MRGEPIRAVPKPVKAPKVRKRMRRGPSRRVKRQTDAEKAYLAWIHTQPCVRAWALECEGELQAAHLRDMTGMGRKEPDATCIPLCRKHHEDLDQASGFFLGTSKPLRKAWHRLQLDTVRARYAATTRAGT